MRSLHLADLIGQASMMARGSLKKGYIFPMIAGAMILYAAGLAVVAAVLAG